LFIYKSENRENVKRLHYRGKMSGPECCSNAPILNPNYGAGHVEKLGGLDTYVTGPSNSNLAILMVSEIFGTSKLLLSLVLELSLIDMKLIRFLLFS
jgi:hypothetical protein